MEKKCCFIEQHCNKNGETLPILAYELKLTGMEYRNTSTQIHLFFSFLYEENLCFIVLPLLEVLIPSSNSTYFLPFLCDCFNASIFNSAA